MIHPVRLQLSRRAGSDLQALSRSINGLPAIIVSRPRKYGNPFRIGEPVDLLQAKKWGWDIPLADRDSHCESAAQAVARFGIRLTLDSANHYFIRLDLQGCNLACWCGLCDRHAKTGLPAGERCSSCSPCHADPLLELANLGARKPRKECRP